MSLTSNLTVYLKSLEQKEGGILNRTRQQEIIQLGVESHKRVIENNTMKKKECFSEEINKTDPNPR